MSDMNISFVRSEQSPVFSTKKYTIKPLTTNNILTFHIKEFYNIFLKKDANYKNFYENVFFCIKHRFVLKEPQCSLCLPFETFNKTFAFESAIGIHLLPPPLFYSQKNLNYFRTFIQLSDLNYKISQNRSLTEHEKNKELVYYNNFISTSFNFGFINKTLSGKLSLFRKKLLGFKCNGIRMTLTIDCKLKPNQVQIPVNIYKRLKLATNFVIINRDPSFNSRCIYVCNLETHEDKNDHTIHINPFILDGLHADQDGDELTVFVIKKKENNNSFLLNCALDEIKNLSWTEGKRHDVFYKNRYTFSQYYRYLIYKYSELLERHHWLWKDLNYIESFSEKLNTILDLGCSIYKNDLDTFISLIIELSRKIGPQLVNTNDILNCENSIENIVKSGAKGTVFHIETFKNQLYNTIASSEFYNMTEKNFNKYIHSSTKLSEEGFKLFNLLYSFNSLLYHLGKLYINEKILIANYNKSNITAHTFYNRGATNYWLNKLSLVQ